MKLTSEIYELVGMHIGDGCLSSSKNREQYFITGDRIEEKEYYEYYVAPLFNKNIAFPILGKNIQVKSYKSVGVCGLFISDKRVFKFFTKLGIISGSKIHITIPQVFLEDKSKILFLLRGLFDTDGSLYFEKNNSSKSKIHNRPRIKLGSTSSLLINQVYKILEEFGFHPKIKNPHKGKRDKNTVYTILLYRVGDIKRWMNQVGFKSSKHHSKWRVYKELGYCPPYTTIAQRKEILKQKLLKVNKIKQ